MSPALAWLVIAVAVLAALLAMLRVWRHARRHRATLLVLQPAIAAALAAAVLLPHVPGPTRLHVLTEGADAGSLSSDADSVRLPGANPLPGAAAWPSLAALLRAHPSLDTLIAHGHGLNDEDLEALGDRNLLFQPAPAPQGIVELQAPTQVRAGARFAIKGRVRPAKGALLRLLDPAGTLQAEATPMDDGRFSLEAVAPVPGRHAFRLELLATDEPVHALPIAVAADTPDGQRGLLLAAAPSAELRALRRWAADAGVDLDARITLAPGLPLQDGAIRLDAATLAQADLLILDERIWPASAAERAALHDAVQEGLGVLLRISGPVAPGLVEQIDQLAGRPAPATGDHGASALAVARDAEAPQPVLVNLGGNSMELHAWPVDFASDAVPLLKDQDGGVLGAWRPVGRGRVGILTVSDTFRLAAGTHASAYATLWSGWWSQLARGDAAMPLTVASAPVQGRRATVCGGSGDLVVTDAKGATTQPLVRDATAGDCAAWYPQQTGWHRIEAPNDAAAVHVASASDLAPLLRETRRQATLARATHESAPTPPAPWPWRVLLLAAWLLLLSVSWLLERRAQSATSPPTPAAGQGESTPT